MEGSEDDFDGDPLVPPDQLLVIMTVDIGNGKSCEIQVHQGDDPEALAACFVAEQGLEPDAVIAETDSGPLTLLPMLVEHIRSNKQAAYERVMASFLPSPEFGDEDSSAHNTSHDDSFGVDSDNDVLPDNSHRSRLQPIAEVAPVRAGKGVAPPPVPRAGGERGGTVDADHDRDDSSLSGRAPSVVSSTASSTRRLMGTEEERELQYNALRQQFGGVGGKAVSGKRGGRGGSWQSAGSPRSPQHSMNGDLRGYAPDSGQKGRRVAKDVPLPRVATLKPRQPAELDAGATGTQATLKRVPSKPVNEELFSRLYTEAVDREQRLQKLREEQHKREVADCKQFRDPSMGGAGFHRTTSPPMPGGGSDDEDGDGRMTPITKQGTRLYQLGLQSKVSFQARMAHLKEKLDKESNWVCALCAHTNPGLVDVCQNIVKSGKEYGRARMLQSTLRLGGSTSPRRSPDGSEIPPEKVRGDHGFVVQVCGAPRPLPFHPVVSVQPDSDTRYNKDHLELFKVKHEAWERERKRLQEAGHLAAMKECTFHPKISSSSAAIIEERRGAGSSAMAVHVRLFEDAARIKKKQEHRQQKANEMENITFRPELTSTHHGPASGVPVHERLYAEMVHKEERLEQMLVDNMGVDWKTGRKLFEPEVGRAPVSRNPFNIPIGDLLFEKRHHTQDIRAALAEEIAEEEAKKRRVKFTTATSARIVDQLRLSAWGRVFRRLQRSVTYSDAQKAAIWRRQVALGIREGDATAAKDNTGKDAAESKGASGDSEDGPETALLGSSLRSPLRGDQLSALPKKTSQFSSVASRTRSSSIASQPVPPPPPGGAISFIDVANDPDYVKYESEDSGDEHRPGPPGELVVNQAWWAVLDPELEAILTPALEVMGDTAVDFATFCRQLDTHMEKSRPAPHVYLLTKKNKRAKLREEKDQREFAQVTLHPVINPQSHTIPNRGPEQQYQHYKLYEKRRRDKAEKIRAAEMAQCTFKPKTNKVPYDVSRAYGPPIAFEGDASVLGSPPHNSTLTTDAMPSTAPSTMQSAHFDGTSVGTSPSAFLSSPAQSMRLPLSPLSSMSDLSAARHVVVSQDASSVPAVVAATSPPGGAAANPSATSSLVSPVTVPSSLQHSQAPSVGSMVVSPASAAPPAPATATSPTFAPVSAPSPASQPLTPPPTAGSVTSPSALSANGAISPQAGTAPVEGGSRKKDSLEDRIKRMLSRGKQ